jgi:hypothetical protein
MNGGTKRKVLLLPVLLQHQQQQGSQLGASATSVSSVSLVSHSSSGVSLQHKLPGGITGLWSGAEGFEGSAANAAAAPAATGMAVAGDSCSSLSSISAADAVDAAARSYSSLAEAQQQQRLAAAGESSSGSRPAALRAILTSSSTLTRAEAAMTQHWFGGDVTPTAIGSGAVPAAAVLHASGGAAYSTSPGSQNMHVLSGNGHVPGLMQQQAASQPAVADSDYWGVWRLHSSCGSHYPSPTGAHLPLLSAEDAASGVAAVAFNPAGDAVVAFVDSCCCLVVWKIAASWTQKLTSIGSNKPSSHQPHAYIAVPTAATLRQLAAAGGTAAGRGQGASHTQHHLNHTSQQQQGGGEMSRWQLRWQAERLVDLLHQGKHCATLEVTL